ncbi:D-aminoacyl-tRNA deacylase [Candidatus Ruthturnera calyptogenae]
MNLSIKEVSGGLLVISQFTLAAKCQFSYKVWFLYYQVTRTS